MSDSVELSQIDRRYEHCRVRNATTEARLLDEISRQGLQQPLLGTWQDETFILLDGFKRLRCAEQLRLSTLDVRAIGEDQAVGILSLMQTAKIATLNIFEEARFIGELIETHGMSIGEVAKRLRRSKTWVSMRRALLTEMSDTTGQFLALGQFPVYSYMYTLRPFMRMNAVGASDLEKFVQAVAGRSLSIRDIELLADSYFRGPAALRAAIDQGSWRWCLQQIKATLQQPDVCTAAEQSLLRDLLNISKLMAKVSTASESEALSTPSFLAEANLSSVAILSQLPAFQQAMEKLHARSRHV